MTSFAIILGLRKTDMEQRRSSQNHRACDLCRSEILYPHIPVAKPRANDACVPPTTDATSTTSQQVDRMMSRLFRSTDKQRGRDSRTEQAVVLFPHCHHAVHLSCLLMLAITKQGNPNCPVCDFDICNPDFVGKTMNEITELDNRQFHCDFYGQEHMYEGALPLDIGNDSSESRNIVELLEKQEKEYGSTRQIVAHIKEDIEAYDKILSVFQLKLGIEPSNELFQEPTSLISHDIICALFSDSETTLWTFVNAGGDIAWLVDCGVTWNHLCTMGLKELQERFDGQGRRVFLWPGHNRIRYLCLSRICMTFGMFFVQIAKANFAILGEIPLTYQNLCDLGFSFISDWHYIEKDISNAWTFFSRFSNSILVQRFFLTDAIYEKMTRDF